MKTSDLIFSSLEATQRERSSFGDVSIFINAQRILKVGNTKCKKIELLNESINFKHFLKELQKVAVATLTLLIILLSAINSYSQVLDTTFGANGIVSIPNTSEIYHFDFDGYGNIIAAGNNGSNLIITKTDENGNLISSFGNNGIVELTGYTSSGPRALKITDDNKILIWAECTPNTSMVSTYLMQFNEDGTQDTNFAPNGKIYLPVSTPHFVNFEKEFMLMITPKHQNNISKCNYNGVLDPTFGVGGTVVPSFYAHYAKSLSDSSIIVVGGTGQVGLVVCKLTANGNIDSTFATNGIWHLDVNPDSVGYEFLNYVIEEPNGDLVLSGRGFTGLNLFFCKLSSNGVQDLSFGNNGFYCSNISLDADIFNMGLPVLKNGNKYITVGKNSDIICINNNGTIDSTFGTAGYFSFANLNLTTFDMKLQGKNKVVLGGNISGAGFTLVRFIIDTTIATISGTIITNGIPLANVTLSCPACLTQTETTDQNGEYSFSVTKGISAKIEPVLVGYIFDPTDTTINNIQQNFTNVDFLAIDTTTLLPKTYTVSGNITYNGNPLANVLIDTTTALITAKSVLITDATGYYEINDIPENRSLTITPTLEGYKFDPPSYTFTATNNKTVNFIAEEELGINNYQLGIGNYELTVYPNPTNGIIIITAVGADFTPAQNGASIQIYDISGRVVDAWMYAIRPYDDNHEFTIDISGLQSGVYFVKIENKIEKVVKE